MLVRTLDKGRSRDRMLCTADVSSALHLLNNNATWKNQSGKLGLTRTLKAANKSTLGGENMMTEEQIDDLFNKPRKTEADTWANTEEKDFLTTVGFLRVADDYDKLLSGMKRMSPSQGRLKPEQPFGKQNNNQEDLTQRFKNNFLVGKVVGEGAYASVRVAVYRPLNKKIAIKVYEKAKLKDPQRKKSVRREIRILQTLNHLNIVKIYDVVESNNHLNIVMEYLGGIPLNNYLKGQENKRISEKQCRRIGRGLAEALKYLHKLNISHRDIKMENVILDENLSPKLIDFGFSTCIESTKKVKLFCGTPSYMAPEIVQKKQYRGQTADVWALGVLLFVCLTGVFPFKGSSDQELYSRINKVEYPKNELLAYSKQINDLISKMLTYNSQERITPTQILLHPWFTANPASSSKKKSKPKRVESSSIENINAANKKRLATTISSHKSKESWAQTQKDIRRLTETSNKQNLKSQIRRARQSPSNSGGKYYVAETTLPQDTHLNKDKDSSFSNYFKKIEKSGQVSKERLGMKKIKSSKSKERETPAGNCANNKKSWQAGNDLRILDILRSEMKRRQEKSKSKNR